MSSVQAFNTVMEEFLQELMETFPEEKKLQTYYNSFTMVKKANKKAALHTFMTEVAKHADKIANKNEQYFLECNDGFIQELNISKCWNSSLSQATKDAIWQYLHTLLALGNNALNC